MEDKMKHPMKASVDKTLSGLPVDREILFSNHKGIFKKKIEKRQAKLMEKITFIEPFLQKGERITLVTTGCSPISLLEQLLTGWIVFYLKRSLFIFTNRRIFHIPTRMNYAYRNSIAHILFADCESIVMKGRALIIKYKNSTKEKFYYIAGKERKKIKTLLKNIQLTGEQSKAMGRTHLCPRCAQELGAESFTCPNCRLEFKSKSEGKKVSLIYPGGGYFYSNHLFLGIGDAITELVLSIGVIMSLIGVIQGQPFALTSLIMFGVILALEKLVTVYHSNQFITEYIPREKEIKYRAGEGPG